MKSRILLGAAVLLSVAACNKKAEGQTVAVVNGEEITSSELNAELTNANIPQGADKKQATNQVLQGLIDRRLLADQAKKEGIDKSPEYITRERRMREDLLIGILANRQLDTSKLPGDSEIAAYQAKNPQVFGQREIWKLSQVQYETPSNPAVLTQIAQAKTMDQLTDVLTRNRIAFQRGNNQVLTNSIPAEIFTQLRALGPAEPFIVPAGNRSIANVITSREPSPLEGAAARTEAANMVRRQNSAQSLQQRLKDLRSSAKIEYKEGFGAPK